MQDHLKIFTESGVRKVRNTDTGKVYEDIVTLTTNLNDDSPANTGVISLLPLYNFAKKYKSRPEDGMLLERTQIGKEYCSECSEVTVGVPESKGFYLWGMFDRRKYWHSIYLGKAGFGRASSLRKRIGKELKNERACVWRSFIDENEIHRIRKLIHPGRPYTWRCALNKWGATHIIWASANEVKDRDIRAVEADLIEAFDPIGNIQRKPPAPEYQRHAVEIFKKLRQCIHARRGEKPILQRSQEQKYFKHLKRG